ncbi:MAG: FAD-dependent oxidoreductase [Candidatus Aminicenantaceae bacterium]
MEKEYDAIVIGAGLGSLVCGATLAKEGWSTLVLERHARPGGYCTSFVRKGFTFSIPECTGSCGPDGDVGKIISYLGLTKDIEFIEKDPFWKYIYPEHTIRVPVDVERYERELSQLFPNESGIHDYFETLEKIWLETHGWDDTPTISRYRNKTFQNLLDDYLSDSKLKAILSSAWGYRGLPSSRVDAVSLAITLMSFHDGAYSPRGGYQKLADAFANGLKRDGGTLSLRTQVTKIIIEGGKAVGVTLQDGTQIKAKHIISNADTKLTFLRLVGEEHLEKGFAQRIKNLKMSKSGFVVHLGVDMDLTNLDLKYGTIFHYPSYNTDAAFIALEKNEIITDIDKMGFFGLSVPSLGDPSLAPPGQHCLHILLLAPYHYKNDWMTEEGKRGEEYKRLKEELADRLIKAAEKVIPNLSQHIVTREVDTPMTYERYTLSSEGAWYDVALTPDQAGENRLQIKTPIEGLYLTGASTWGGGTQPAILSGFGTANFLTGWKSYPILAKSQTKEDTMEANKFAKQELICREIIAGMPTTFNAEAAGDIVADIYYKVTGEEPGDYYLEIAKGTCTFHEGVPASPKLTIETPSEVWVAISTGKLDGQQAFMEQKYKASGDFSLLMKLNSLFSTR